MEGIRGYIDPLFREEVVRRIQLIGIVNREFGSKMESDETGDRRRYPVSQYSGAPPLFWPGSAQIPACPLGALAISSGNFSNHQVLGAAGPIAVCAAALTSPVTLTFQIIYPKLSRKITRNEPGINTSRFHQVIAVVDRIDFDGRGPVRNLAKKGCRVEAIFRFRFLAGCREQRHTSQAIK